MHRTHNQLIMKTLSCLLSIFNTKLLLSRFKSGFVFSNIIIGVLQSQKWFQFTVHFFLRCVALFNKQQKQQQKNGLRDLGGGQ